MKFHGKEKVIMISILVLYLISIALVFLKVLPFIIFPITILVTFIIEFYIFFKWLRWKSEKNDKAYRNLKIFCKSESLFIKNS